MKLLEIRPEQVAGLAKSAPVAGNGSFLNFIRGQRPIETFEIDDAALEALFVQSRQFCGQYEGSMLRHAVEYAILALDFADADDPRAMERYFRQLLQPFREMRAESLDAARQQLYGMNTG